MRRGGEGWRDVGFGYCEAVIDDGQRRRRSGILLEDSLLSSSALVARYDGLPALTPLRRQRLSDTLSFLSQTGEQKGVI